MQIRVMYRPTGRVYLVNHNYASSRSVFGVGVKLEGEQWVPTAQNQMFNTFQFNDLVPVDEKGEVMKPWNPKFSEGQEVRMDGYGSAIWIVPAGYRRGDSVLEVMSKDESMTTLGVPIPQSVKMSIESFERLAVPVDKKGEVMSIEARRIPARHKVTGDHYLIPQDDPGSRFFHAQQVECRDDAVPHKGSVWHIVGTPVNMSPVAYADFEPLTSETETTMTEPASATPTKPNYYRFKVRGQEMDIIDIIQAIGLGCEAGNVYKYLCRAGRKDASKHVEDLKKAREWLDRLIQFHEGEAK